MMGSTKGRAAALLLAAALVAGAAACGDDDDGGDEGSGTTTTEAMETTESTETTAAPAGEEIAVTLADYEFKGLPAEMAAGSTLTVSNESEVELHELVAIKLPDDEERSIEELLALPEEEQAKVVPMDQEPATVLLAPPGSDQQIAAVGDGTIDEPGRYLIACFIPTGADPDEYLNAEPSPEGGPPSVAGGPPHFTQGMFAELRVT